MPLSEVETPIGVLDLERVYRNASRVAEYCATHSISWRPHVKTHKSPEIARRQIEAGAAGLTVATPREAEVMSAVSDDLLVAYPILGHSKLDRLMGLPSGVRLMVGLDSHVALSGLSAAASAAGRTVRVLVEADVGLGRVGLGTDTAAVDLARAVRDSSGVEFAGIMFYPGHIRAPGREQDAELVELTSRLSDLYAALEVEGLAPGIVSGGSTPTLWRSHEIPGLTEVRPGTAIFFDREGVDLGVATLDEVAYTVLATVVSTAVPGHAVVDAGSKALSKEARTGGDGYGVLLDRPDVLVKGLSEEHGVLDLGTTGWSPAVGDRVRIVPNHVCLSVNLQDRLLALEGEGSRWIELPARGRRPWVEEVA